MYMILVVFIVQVLCRRIEATSTGAKTIELSRPCHTAVSVAPTTPTREHSAVEGGVSKLQTSSSKVCVLFEAEFFCPLR
jgi:hypothetical protein